MIRRFINSFYLDVIAFAILVIVAIGWVVVALGQVNSQFGNTWYTVGNQQVGGTVMMCLNNNSNAIPCAVNSSGSISGLPVAVTTAYPINANPITASTTGTTAATTATLAGAANKLTYLCTFSINSTATAAAAGNATVTNTVTGTLNYEMGTGVSPAVVITSQTFNPCVPSNGANTAINVISAAPGTGGVISVTATGYQL